MGQLKKRDVRFDALKGIAAIIVVLGHILHYGYSEYWSLTIYNIIWSIQIPLFMVVSGYFSGGGTSLNKVLKKARLYLIPYFSFCCLKKFLVLRDFDFLSFLKDLFYPINSLWFVFVLFEISLVHIIAVKIAEKISAQKGLSFLLKYSIFFGLCLIPFIAIAATVGTAFLGIKYVLYYSVFYYIGFSWKTLYGIYENKTDVFRSKANAVIDILTLFAVVAYVFVIANINLYQIEDDLFGIAIRFVTGSCGVLVLVKTVFAVYKEDGRGLKALSAVGKYSLEIYYLHFLFIPYTAKIVNSLTTPIGLIEYAVEFVAAMCICAVMILIIKSSKLLSFIIFGKLGDEK